MDLAMQTISTDKTVRSEAVQDLKHFNIQSLTTRSNKREQFFSMMPAIKRLINFWVMS